MTAIILTMLLVLVAATGVVVYVAWPHRGADVPGAPWLGDAMRKGVERLPTLEEDQHADAQHDVQHDVQPDARPHPQPGQHRV
ncbi:hypothetical protein [uncultured Nocardioides sp.]|uniref:hypothetical protein n=1 Tax=uncultured Nocardioides sp. TaxID=198441 RepID=UPI0025DF4AF2|nr:hypothetical protein [uncultured Nocardioides sp.]